MLPYLIDTKKFFFIFLQDIRKFEEVGSAEFLELIQHTMDLFLFNKTISLFYSLFVFRLCYKIIGLSSLNLAGRGLTHLWPAGMGWA